MKTAIHVAAPPARPLVVFDGDCNFCRVWIRRWQHTTGDRVAYLPSQDPSVAQRFPEIPVSNYQSSVYLIETDGKVFSGAEAAFRALAHNPEERWFIDWYEHSSFFARASERLYRLVASNRSFFSFLTRMGWGTTVGPQTHDLVRSVFVRSIAAIYLIAFVSLWVQIDGLVGEQGITPAALTMKAARQQVQQAGVGLKRYRLLPTFCWWNASDRSLHLQCLAGTALAVLALIGIAQGPALFLLWLIYLSLCTVCREFLSFQWDILLLEAGFLAIFFAPLGFRFWRKPRARPSVAILWLLRWLIFRLMFESGVVKLVSQDPTWRNFTALYYHYETQPLPTWIGWFAHQMPPDLQRVSVAGMFVIELALPFLIFGPRRIRHFAAGGFVLLQVFIFLTGNYSFFNLLTIALCIPLLDDEALRSLFPYKKVKASCQRLLKRGGHGPVAVAATPEETPDSQQCNWAARPEPPVPVPINRPQDWLRPFKVAVLFLIIPISLLQLSFMFAVPLPWPQPVLQTYEWFVPFRSINSYGLFAVMTTNRQEIVVQGSNDGVNWADYEFKFKPQALNRRPRFVAPHQPRLDWQMWFAALSTYRENPWFLNFCVRLLEGSPPVLKLLNNNPFPNAPPKYIRAVSYEYHFTNFRTRRQTGNWWRRGPASEYLPPISLRPNNLVSPQTGF